VVVIEFEVLIVRNLVADYRFGIMGSFIISDQFEK